MTLLELLKEIRDMNALDRVRRVKVGDIELELAEPIDTEPKTMKLDLPEPVTSQVHGNPMKEDEAKLLEEIELRQGFYAAAQGVIPSDYVPTS